MLLLVHDLLQLSLFLIQYMGNITIYTKIYKKYNIQRI